MGGALGEQLIPGRLGLTKDADKGDADEAEAAPEAA